MLNYIRHFVPSLIFSVLESKYLIYAVTLLLNVNVASVSDQ
jgi:hypothetical protein